MTAETARRDPSVEALSLKGMPRDPAIARRHVATVLREPRFDGVRDDVSLVVSELVTNAVVHGRGPVRLVVGQRDDGVLVEVTDREGSLPRVRHVSAEADHGRGLMIVSTVARDWGVRRTARHKTVWCDLAL